MRRGGGDSDSVGPLESVSYTNKTTLPPLPRMLSLPWRIAADCTEAVGKSRNAVQSSSDQRGKAARHLCGRPHPLDINAVRLGAAAEMAKTKLDWLFRTVKMIDIFSLSCARAITAARAPRQLRGRCNLGADLCRRRVARRQRCSSGLR